MKISIFGLGYVGAVSAGCLAFQGNNVIGVDPYKPKIDSINSGLTPIIEKDIGELIKDGVGSGRLRATTDVKDAISNTEISFICVGTPSQPNGGLDLQYVTNVCEQIGMALKDKNDFHVVVVRSTVLPGTMQSTVIPTLEKFSGKKSGKDFGVCNNPEFLRESTAVYDYFNPPKTVIGEMDDVSGDLLAAIYKDIDAPMIRTKIEVAELVKYTDNVWHALKIGFANEIGNISKELKIDGHEVMDIFCQDTKLNLSPYYLKPGFAFGGSCLPKDVRALTYKAKSLDLNLPIMNSILANNNYQIDRGISMVINGGGKKKIGILGFAFKAGTDDLRESPLVEVIERLLGKGYDIRLYDKNVSIASLVGANKDYILNQIPHIHRLMASGIDEVLDHAETLVLGTNDAEFTDLSSKIRPDQTIIDLVRINSLSNSGMYKGICW
ncbi:nucleotide sugar dehydrogenase [Aestuariicella hydrocarbonica]|uniref:UDP-glucose 6-dehydrogenase n=1 Tax=Pseudomaricurvus hydrocarbonicus TaxID=1470433 RepID=A0A9E5JXM0_9GAMM|nr:nucleotide sugar dehydrogenase [Aestuariicella hydrocarbonica]NHO63932.1 nucleotide sugar dehydrogenase [Aestuariicella hydrocarbonica]